MRTCKHLGHCVSNLPHRYYNSPHAHMHMDVRVCEYTDAHTHSQRDSVTRTSATIWTDTGPTTKQPQRRRRGGFNKMHTSPHAHTQTHTDVHTFNVMNEINKTTVWRNLEPMKTGTGLLVRERPHTTELSHTHTHAYNPHSLATVPVEKRLWALGWGWALPWRMLWRCWWR